MPITPADEKALAMYYAYTALARALCLNGSLKLQDLMTQLEGAHQQLHRIGEDGAAQFLGSMRDNLKGLDQ
jgi:hypothetical protein